jgi:hypothetical protein
MGASSSLVMLLKVKAEDFHEWVSMMAAGRLQIITTTTMPDRGVEGQHQ